MPNVFELQELRVQQPGKWMADRARYEIFDHGKKLVAVVEETSGHKKLTLLSKALPDTRVFAVTDADGEPLLTLSKYTSEWITELRDPAGSLVGRIRTEGSRRHYTLLDAEGATIGQAVGDLGLKKFSVTPSDGGRQCAKFSKTFAGMAKEWLTASDHYSVEFTGPATPTIRMLTVMMPIVLDLTLYGPT
jgi:uncharacterized protein YxjI